MYLSVRYNFLFVHIAKTGGTSIRAALAPYRWRDPYRIPMMICSRLSGLCGHRIGAKIPRHARIIAAQEMLPKEFFDGLFKFAFVRNPWDLQVSSFHHIRRERPHLMEGIDDFETFIRWKLNPDRPYQYHVDTSIQHQLDYLIDLNGKEIVDFIGQYENFETDFHEACRHIGFHPMPSLPHKRKAATRKPYQTYYTPETAALVGSYFKRDIDRFGYSFKGNS
jgi:hypothetical protein